MKQSDVSIQDHFSCLHSETNGPPASVAQLDALPTADQEVAGSTLPSADSRRAVVSFWQKNVHNTG